jgi:hypothetical protein
MPSHKPKKTQRFCFGEAGVKPFLLPQAAFELSAVSNQLSFILSQTLYTSKKQHLGCG